MPYSKILFFFIISFGLLFVSCSEDDEMDQDHGKNAISVEGFVYANEPVSYIKLAKINENGSSTGTAMVRADVSINQGNLDIPLFHSDSIPGYYHQSDSTQTIGTESDLTLHITNEGIAYALPAQIPPGISGLNISTQNITLTPNHLDSVLATISWDAIDGYSYCIILRNMNGNSFPVNYLDGEELHLGAFYTIHHSNIIQLKCSDFTHYGNYDLYITAVNNDYANFYSNIMAQPVVENAAGEALSWGIFTAFNGKTINIQVN